MDCKDKGIRVYLTNCSCNIRGCNGDCNHVISFADCKSNTGDLINDCVFFIKHDPPVLFNPVYYRQVGGSSDNPGHPASDALHHLGPGDNGSSCTIAG